MNVQLLDFQANLMTIMNRINRFTGKKGIAEQVFKGVGIETYIMQSNGEIVRNERKPALTLIK